ncbi:MAG: hypothetical protein V1887_02915 [Candidatus Aenigmatarchaeota archaeon]
MRLTKVKDGEAKRAAYIGVARMDQMIGQKDVYIIKHTQLIDDYVNQGLTEEAKPLAETIAKAELDKKRLFRKRMVYHRALANMEIGASDVGLKEVDSTIGDYLKQRGDVTIAQERFGEVVDGLGVREESEGLNDGVLDGMQGQQGVYSDRANAILQASVARVGQRKARAEQLREEAAIPAKEAV